MILPDFCSFVPLKLEYRYNNAALVEAIISVARNFNLAIVAEGVETPAQAEFLRVRGCHLYQGYLFARPMPMAEFDQQLGYYSQQLKRYFKLFKPEQIQIYLYEDLRDNALGLIQNIQKR